MYTDRNETLYDNQGGYAYIVTYIYICLSIYEIITL